MRSPPRLSREHRPPPTPYHSHSPATLAHCHHRHLQPRSHLLEPLERGQGSHLNLVHKKETFQGATRRPFRESMNLRLILRKNKPSPEDTRWRLDGPMSATKPWKRGIRGRRPRSGVSLYLGFPSCNRRKAGGGGLRLFQVRCAGSGLARWEANLPSPRGGART